MKQRFKTLVWMVCLTPALLCSCYFPGSDYAKIKTAATGYIKMKLKEGETMQWQGINRKNGRNFAGKDCKYAEVNYTLTSPTGNEQPKILYLLMSEHCDSVYDVAECADKEWNNTRYPSAEEVEGLIKEVIGN